MCRRNGKYLTCSKCRTEYYSRAGRCDNSKFCTDCWKERNPPSVKECAQCGKGFFTYERKTKRFCSMDCRDKYTSIYKVGEKANGYKDGRSLERDRARMAREFKLWKKTVKERDNCTCQHCGSKKELHAHHIIEWAKDESKRFDADNGLTLCIDCHGKVHGRNFRKLDPSLEIKKNGEKYEPK